MSGVKFTNMRYGNDIVIVAKMKDDIQRMVDKTEEQCKRIKLEVSENKTKSMKISIEREAQESLIKLKISNTLDNTKEKKVKQKSIREWTVMEQVQCHYWTNKKICEEGLEM